MCKSHISKVYFISNKNVLLRLITSISQPALLDSNTEWCTASRRFSSVPRSHLGCVLISSFDTGPISKATCDGTPQKMHTTCTVEEGGGVCPTHTDCRGKSISRACCLSTAVSMVMAVLSCAAGNVEGLNKYESPAGFYYPLNASIPGGQSMQDAFHFVSSVSFPKCSMRALHHVSDP